jgi:hypothetical protein
MTFDWAAELEREGSASGTPPPWICRAVPAAPS